ARDDPQDLAGRRLLLQRLREIAVAHRQLLEQAHVLDGDDSLVGEGLQELDAARREGGDVPVADTNGTHHLRFAPEGYHYDAATPPGAPAWENPRKWQALVRLGIGDVDHVP